MTILAKYNPLRENTPDPFELSAFQLRVMLKINNNGNSLLSKH
jgi:hypothetical protein